MKHEVVFGLEEAGWPVLLVDRAGVVRKANRAAARTFCTHLNSPATSLAAIWLQENTLTPEQFLAGAAQSQAPMASVKLLGNGDTSLPFQASICPVSAARTESFFLVQLLPPAEISEAKNPGLEAGLAQKQKLDCALQLARTVALDFNNALTSILGHTSLILAKLEPDNPWRKSLVEVEKSASKAAEIANDLANFSRQEKENRVQQAGNVNVLLQRNVDMFKSIAPEQLGKEISWSLQLERRLYATKFDEAKMQQAFLKILENAVEALGPNGRIHLQTRNIDLTEPTQDRNAQLAAGTYVCVEITDSGVGIEPHVLPRIFEPFFTTKRADKHRGLGLAWLYGIVTNHGGAVAVSSQPGVGTSVRVYLPANNKVVKDEGVQPADLSGTHTILMVDDEDLLLTMGQAILSAYGYRVLTANSGQKALDLLSEGDTQVDLVVTDLVMPGMSGRELVERVRQLAPETRILCSSGYVRPTSQEHQEAGYLQKPFTSQELLLKVKQALS
jgi:two-component system, cell cycle sensor histidine kinase and response regulator CckA